MSIAKRTDSNFRHLMLGALLIFLVGALGSNVASAQSSKAGKITGTLVDQETGKALPGAVVMLEGTTMGAAADLHGTFAIYNVPVGTYNVVIQLIGYSKTTVTAVEVTAGEAASVDVALQSEVLTGQTVTVTAKALRNTEASLLKERQRSEAVSDAISAEGLSRVGAGNVADAMRQVTGASVVGGKYIYVRGLGERYSSAQLNGVELPSADPDKKAFQMDLLPSNVLENVVTLKSFTPDRPGNFSGGIVDVGTKDFPERFTLSLSTSSSYNASTTSNDDFLLYSGGGHDWLGMDDGTRDIPAEPANPNIEIFDIGEAYGDPQKAAELDRLSKAFNSEMAPSTKTGPINRSFSISVGDQIQVNDRPLGYTASLSYSRDFSYYDDGQVGSWRLPGNVSDANSLTAEYRFSDHKGSDEVMWGGLAALSYKVHPQHEIAANIIYTRSGESSARYLSGKFYDGNLSAASTFETRVLRYVERTVNSMQLRGESLFKGLGNARLEWTGSYTRNSQDEPDLRFFSDDYSVEGTDTNYSISPNIYKVPQRYYRNLDEDNVSFDAKISLPFTVATDREGTLKFGGAYTNKDRTFRERIFEYHSFDYDTYTGDPESFFSDDNVGMMSDPGDAIRFGSYIVDASEDRSNYDGNQKISAAFGMVDFPVTRRLRLIGGARFEATRMNVLTWDASYAEGVLNDDDLLPSVNLVYQLDSDVNVRAAYGRTIARPTLREMAPFPSYDFANSYFLIGNPNLKRTLVDNYDLRFEWFSRPGEILAVSGFYKSFHNPIEKAIKNDNREIQFQNVGEATVFGAEFEARLRLDHLHASLASFEIGGNFSMVHSRVDIPEFELLVLRQSDPNADDTRPLQGQSPYVLNLNLGYENSDNGLMANLHYNVFGERLSEVSKGGTPDIYEQPFNSLDLNTSYRVLGDLKVKFAAKNLLDAKMKKVHHFLDVDYIYQEHSYGRSFSLGFSLDI